MPNFINQIVKTVVKFIFFCPADGRIFVCVIFYIPNPSLNFCAGGHTLTHKVNPNSWWTLLPVAIYL